MYEWAIFSISLIVGLVFFRLILSPSIGAGTELSEDSTDETVSVGFRSFNSRDLLGEKQIYVFHEEDEHS